MLIIFELVHIDFMSDAFLPPTRIRQIAKHFNRLFLCIIHYITFHFTLNYGQFNQETRFVHCSILALIGLRLLGTLIL